MNRHKNLSVLEGPLFGGLSLLRAVPQALGNFLDSFRVSGHFERL